MVLLIGEIFLKALVLCGILFLVARREADFKFRKVVWVTCVITLVTSAVEIFLAPALAYYMPLPAAAALMFLLASIFVTFMVARFCSVRLWKGIVVAVLFMAFCIGLTVAGPMVMAKIHEFVEKARGSVMEPNNKEALQMSQEMMAGSSSQGMTQAAAEGVKPMPGVSNTNAERVLPPEKSVESPPPQQPADELPAFARTPEWQAAQAKIKVSAVLLERDGSNTAIVNGEVLGIGDILTVEVKKKLYRFKMAEITTDWVAWDPLGETDAD